MSQIHPTAIIHPSARLDPTVEAGPYSVVGENVRIGAGTVLMDRVTIGKNTVIGRKNAIYTGAALGHDAQHRNAVSEGTSLVIGDENVFREYVTVHRGFEKGGTTTIGNKNYFMAFSHAGHDSRIADGVTIANGSLVAGHVAIESGAVLSGSVVVHQYCRIGRLAMVGGLARVSKDVPPYFLVDDGSESVRSINLVGLKRAGFAESAVREIKRAYRLLYLSGLRLEEALEAIAKECKSAEAKHLVEFIRGSKRGILPHARHAAGETELSPVADE